MLGNALKIECMQYLINGMICAFAFFLGLGILDYLDMCIDGLSSHYKMNKRSNAWNIEHDIKVNKYIFSLAS